MNSLGGVSSHNKLNIHLQQHHDNIISQLPDTTIVLQEVIATLLSIKAQHTSVHKYLNTILYYFHMLSILAPQKGTRYQFLLRLGLDFLACAIYNCTIFSDRSNP